MDAAITDDLVCDPAAQTRCTPEEKCTWVVDSVAPVLIGHIGCVPTGGDDKAVGEACMEGSATATGADDCVTGSVCAAGECKTIYDLTSAATSGCDGQHA